MPDIYSPTSAEPYSTPSLQARVANAINALRGKYPALQQPISQPKTAPETPSNVNATDDTPSGRGLPDATYISAFHQQWADLFRYGVARNQRYSEYDALDNSTVAAMLDAVVDSCLVSDDGSICGIKVESKSSKYQTVIDQVIEDLNLNFNLRFILRDVLKYGDCYVAPVYSNNWAIVDYDNPHPRQMYKFTNQHLLLLSGTEKLPLGKNGEMVDVPVAFQQKNDAMVTVAGWFPWEMFHIRFVIDKRALYSTKSLIEDIRADVYKLRMIEESLVIHRLTRAAPRNVHYLDVTGKSTEEAKSALNEYLAGMTQKKLSNNQYVRDTLQVDEDYVVGLTQRQGGDGKLYNSVGEIKTIDARNAALTRLPDVDYLTRKIFSRVPSELVGVLPDRNDITSQDIAASRFYTYLQTVLEQQLLIPLFSLALRLRGYVPQKGDFKIIFPSAQMRSSWKTSDARFRDAMASNTEIEGGVVSRKFVAQSKYGFSDAEWDAQRAEIKKEMDELGQLPNATKPALTRKGEMGTSPESLDAPPETILEQFKREYAEQTLPLVQELRELKQELNALKQHPQSPQPPITVNVPERPIHINVPEQKVEVHPAQVTVEQPQLNFTFPEQQPPIVNVAPPQVSVNVPKQDPPTIHVTPEVNVENIVPEQPAPIVVNEVNVPEPVTPIVQNTINVPEQPPPTIHVAPEVKVENIVPEQSTTINVSPTPITVNPPLVSVHVPEQPAPQVNNTLNLPEQFAHINVQVPAQEPPIFHVTPEVKVENIIPEQTAPVVNVTIDVPKEAINVDVSAVVELPDEEEMSFERDNLGKVVGATKKRKYTRRKKKQDEGSGNSGDSD